LSPPSTAETLRPGALVRVSGRAARDKLDLLGRRPEYRSKTALQCRSPHPNIYRTICRLRVLGADITYSAEAASRDGHRGVLSCLPYSSAESRHSYGDCRTSQRPRQDCADNLPHCSSRHPARFARCRKSLRGQPRRRLMAPSRCPPGPWGSRDAQQPYPDR